MSDGYVERQGYKQVALRGTGAHNARQRIWPIGRCELGR
jgi:hypothetical protein